MEIKNKERIEDVGYERGRSEEKGQKTVKLK